MQPGLLSTTIERWFGRPHAPLTEAVNAAAPPGALSLPEVPGSVAPMGTIIAAAIAGRTPARPMTIWTPARLSLTDRLWGPGFGFPGGEMEALRLSRVFGLSPAVSLLLVGGGAGGAACAIAQEFGVRVAAHEVSPALAEAGQALIEQAHLMRKASIASWNPDHPAFEARKFHHCMALEPLCDAPAEPIVDALVRSIRPSGQLLLTALTADAALQPDDPHVARWAVMERRDPARVLSAEAVTRILGRDGLDVRVAEDISQRHIEQMVRGWRLLVRELRGRRPDRAGAAQLVAEAELWLTRWRLLKDGRLKMMRWHAITRG